MKIIRLSNVEFDINIQGTVNLNPETYPTKSLVPFKIKQTAKFNGVVSELEDEKESRNIASQFINVDNLIWKDKLIDNSLSDNWLI